MLDEHAEQIIVSPSQLRDAWLQLEQQLAVFALAVAHVDASGVWGDDGSVSMLAWMRDHLRMSNSDAHAWLRRANLLNQYDAFAECAVTGALSSSQLREVEKCNTARYRPLLRELQEALAGRIEFQTALDNAITWAGKDETRTVEQRQHRSPGRDERRRQRTDPARCDVSEDV